MELPRVHGKTIDFRMNKKVHRGENVLGLKRRHLTPMNCKGKVKVFFDKNFLAFRIIRSLVIELEAPVGHTL
jgi:hypothetical protein